MLSVSINYPNAHVTIHQDPTCASVRMMGKADQRHVRIDATSLSQAILRFERQEHRFGSTPELNEMWLDVDFGDSSFERAVVEFILRLLARRYSPFREVEPGTHCG